MQLRHSNISTTGDIYTHVEEDQLDEVASYRDDQIQFPSMGIVLPKRMEVLGMAGSSTHPPCARLKTCESEVSL